MLIDYLASIYQYHDSIVWDKVIERPEFAGHTTDSLVSCLLSLRSKAAKFLGTDKRDVTLQKVAELVKDKSISASTRLGVKKLIRQQNVISYFEQCVKKKNLNIRNAVQSSWISELLVYNICGNYKE